MELTTLIARYQVKRATLYADAKFAATLDHGRAHGRPGAPRRSGPNPPLTKNDVLRLAKLASNEQKGIVQEVLNTGQPPQWPKKDETGTVHITLPLGHPKPSLRPC